MTTFQEYLDKKYPAKESKEGVKEIIIVTDQDGKFHTPYWKETKELDGDELNLSAYPNLEKVIIYGFYLKSELTSLNISNCTQLIKLDCQHNQLTNLDCSPCPNLEKVSCSYNQITDFNLKGCSKLKELDYSHNPIADDKEFNLYKWQVIVHPNFTEELIKEWKKKDFTLWESEQWIKKGLNLSEAGLASYCRCKGLKLWKEDWDLDQLRTEYLNNPNWQDWTDIHEDFAKKEYYHPYKITYQQIWELLDLTFQDAQEWIPVGFQPKHYNLTIHLKSQGFTLENAKEKSPAQHWLDWHCQLKKRNQFTHSDISRKDLVGALKLIGFVNLKELDCSSNQLTYLDLSGCEKLTSLDCSNNSLTSLLLFNQGEEITKLGLSSNQFADLTALSKLVNLEELDLTWYSAKDSLEPLKNYQRLKRLNIKGKTNLLPNWEYLHKIQEITLLDEEDDLEKKEIKKHRKELIPYQKKTEREKNDLGADIDVIYYDLQAWKQNQPAYQNLQQTLLKINPNLDIQEIINRFEFFNVKTGEFQGDLNNLTFIFSKNSRRTIFPQKNHWKLN